MFQYRRKHKVCVHWWGNCSANVIIFGSISFFSYYLFHLHLLLWCNDTWWEILATDWLSPWINSCIFFCLFSENLVKICDFNFLIETQLEYVIFIVRRTPLPVSFLHDDLSNRRFWEILHNLAESLRTLKPHSHVNHKISEKVRPTSTVLP